MRFPVLLLLTTAALAQPKYDLLLRNGHVIDPKNRIDGPRDVAIAAGKIAAGRAKSIPPKAKKVVDAAGPLRHPGPDRHPRPRLSGAPTRRPARWTSPSTPTPSPSAAASPPWSMRAPRAGKTSPTSATTSSRPAKTRMLAFLNIVASGMHTGRRERSRRDGRRERRPRR